MSEQALTVIARVKAQEGKLERVEEVLKGLIEPTRKEAGCISYVLHRSTDDACSFVFVEKWTSQSALDEHLQTPYLQAFVAQADDILAEPLDVTLWHELD
jgi:quinol monooxygenase YgiN